MNAIEKKQQVRQMFGAIAGTYDLLNHLLSFNRDHRWRRRAAHLADLQPGERLLDVCCGTGDLAFAFLKQQPELAEVVGVDFSQEMLEIAKLKIKNQRSKILQSKIQNPKSKINDIKWLCADAEALPFPDQSFDCLSCAFGIRNLGNPARGIAEMARVLKPGGRAVIIEFAPPANPLLKAIYNLYFRIILPRVGNLISRSHAYDYLPQSVGSFNAGTLLPRLLPECGLTIQTLERHNLGGVLIIVARKT